MPTPKPRLLTREESYSIQHIQNLATQLTTSAITTLVSTGFDATDSRTPFNAAVLARDDSDTRTPLSIVFGPSTGISRHAALVELLALVEGQMHGLILQADNYRERQTGQARYGEREAVSSSATASFPILQPFPASSLSQGLADLKIGDGAGDVPERNDFVGGIKRGRRGKSAKPGPKAGAQDIGKNMGGMMDQDEPDINALQAGGGRVLRSRPAARDGVDVVPKSVRAKKTGKKADDVVEEQDEED